MTVETKINKQTNKVEDKAAIFAKGNVFKTLLVTSLPVLILMLTNTLYQIIDSAIAANMVEYTGGGVSLNGSITMMITLPVMLIMISVISLTNMGFGTVFSQRLGQKDEEGAKKAISTAHYTNVIVVVIGIAFSFLMVKPWLQLMDLDLNAIGHLQVAGGSMNLYSDSILTMVLYALTIGFMSFQGVISRQIRSEGHIRAASYIPLVTIPINIFFDMLFMGPLNMGVSGAALGTLIAASVSTAGLILFTMYISRKGETYFKWSILKLGIDWKVFGLIVLIGSAPLALQLLRTYNQILSMYLTKDIGSIGSMELMSAVSRPMMLTTIPAYAILQTAGAMIAYNYGAKESGRVTKTVWSTFALVFLFGIPQFIWIMAWPQSMFYLFGANDFVGNHTIWIQVINESGNRINILTHMSEHDANFAYFSYMGLSIISSVPAIMIIYYLSTRRMVYAIVQTFITFFLVFTIVILALYFTIGQHTETIPGIAIDVNGKISITHMTINPDVHLFFLWLPLWVIFSQVFSWPIFLWVRLKDNVIMLKARKAAQQA